MEHGRARGWMIGWAIAQGAALWALHGLLPKGDAAVLWPLYAVVLAVPPTLQLLAAHRARRLLWVHAAALAMVFAVGLVSGRPVVLRTSVLPPSSLMTTRLGPFESHGLQVPTMRSTPPLSEIASRQCGWLRSPHRAFEQRPSKDGLRREKAARSRASSDARPSGRAMAPDEGVWRENHHVRP